MLAKHYRSQMVSEIWLIKNQFGKLSAEDDAAKKVLSKIKTGEQVQVTIKKPRNVLFHRKFFALCQVVFDNQEVYDDFEAFRKELTMRAAYWKEHHHVTGAISYEAKSISFAAMDDLEFGELYDKAINAAIDHFIPGTDRGELEEAILDFAG